MSELRTSLSIGKAKWVLAGVGGGAGVAIGVAAIRAVTARPEFLPQLLNGQFLFFAALLVGMVIASRKGDAFLAMHERQIIAQEQLTANVGALVSNQSQERRETDLLVNHMARTHEKIAGQYDEILGRLDELKELHGK